MSPLPFTDPPTRATLAQARSEAEEQRSQVAALSAKIQAAEVELERLVKESRCAIHKMERQRAAMEDRLAHTLAYLSPIRRLPNEILTQIFMLVFEDLPCCAWVLSAVSSLWRRRVLAMPILWSKIRLVTTQSASADTIRLWLERSGSTVPLDIEIFLHSPQNSSNEPTSSRNRPSTGTLHGPTAWDTNGGHTAGWVEWNQPPNTPDAGTPAPAHLHVYPTAVFALNPAAAAVVPPPPLLAAQPYGHEIILPSFSWRQAAQQAKSRASMHWGHIAFYYLTEQIHRWERFVFRFDRRFASVDSLKSIVGDAPLLREFEVSCAEPGFFTTSDWPWLPSAKATVAVDLNHLDTLTLQYVPFKWTSPMFHNLRVLSLRALPNNPHALDRILYIVASNPLLESLSIYSSSVNSAILPLTPTTLRNLRTLSIGGHYLLSGLVECFVLPALENLVIDIDAREAIEDTITNLLVHSGQPRITRLSLSYSVNIGSGGGMYYASGSVVTSWNFLAELDHLESLQVGGSPLDPLITALDCPMDDGADQWICPNLAMLSLRSCPTHTSDGVSKLVRMVEARNPAPGTLPMSALGVTPVKLRHLELYDCASLGQDVVRWLNGRIEDVACTEPTFDRPRSPHFQLIAG